MTRRKRTQPELILEIARTMREYEKEINPVGVQLTPIANKIGINYKLAKDILQSMMRDEIVHKNPDGFYTITKLGEKYITIHEMGWKKIAKVIA